MVEANPEWGDEGEENDDWGEWDENDAGMAVDFEEPGLGRNESQGVKIYQTNGYTPYKFVEKVQIRIILQERIEAIQDAMGVSEDLARALLVKNEWNSDLAIKAFAENEEYIKETFGFELGANQVPSGDVDVTCQVCFCDYPCNEFIFLEDCGHGLCEYCFQGYLQSKVGDGPEAVLTVCPEQKCNMIVPERLFQRLVEPEQFQRYHDFLIKSFVDLSKQAKWCPGRDCNMAVEYKKANSIDVRCVKCNKAFCFSCTKDAHLPIDCDSLTTWQDRISSGEDDTSNWMKINTKPCPKCKRPIEKNSGCMHMTCSQCRFEFCWLCMGDYRKHSAETGRGLCNSYDDVKKAGRETQEMDDVDKIERELKRLEHYSMRFIEHQKSIVFAEKASSLIQMQIAQALELNPKYSPNDFQFLIDISGLVVAARRSLSYTYAIRFFLQGSLKQAFFDLIQGDLEKSLEALNKRMEENWLDYVEYDTQGKLLIGQKFVVYKQNVTTLREVVERHLNSSMKEISQGLPSVAEENADGTDYTFDGTNVGKNWTCRVCQVKNPTANENCSTCRTKKPDLSFKAGNKNTAKGFWSSVTDTVSSAIGKGKKK